MITINAVGNGDLTMKQYPNCHLKQVDYYQINFLLNTFKNDSKKMWQVLRTVIGKHTDKSCIPTCFKYNNDLTHDPDQISNTFCNFFTNVGPNYADAIPAPKKNSSPDTYKKSSKKSKKYVYESH